MRQALFGPAQVATQPKIHGTDSLPRAVQQVPAPTANKPRSSAKALSPKLRVTLHVTKEFEGTIEVFTYDANTLSTLVAEQEAKSAAKKKKFKYFDVVSITPLP